MPTWAGTTLNLQKENVLQTKRTKILYKLTTSCYCSTGKNGVQKPGTKVPMIEPALSHVLPSMSCKPYRWFGSSVRHWAKRTNSSLGTLTLSPKGLRLLAASLCLIVLTSNSVHIPDSISIRITPRENTVAGSIRTILFSKNSGGKYLMSSDFDPSSRICTPSSVHGSARPKSISFMRGHRPKLLGYKRMFFGVRSR